MFQSVTIIIKKVNKLTLAVEVGGELADVMIYCIHMADALGVDIKEIMAQKMDKNELKYPVEKAKGTSKT